MKIPRKIRNGNTTWFSNSITGYLFEENKNTNSKWYMHPIVYYSIIYDSQYVGAICQWMDKDVVYIYISNINQILYQYINQIYIPNINQILISH